MIVKRTINTFDVFDTLIARRCVTPTNIFVIMEERLGIPNFANIRIQSERDLLGAHYSFDQIYEGVKRVLGLDHTTVTSIMELEISIELENIIPIKENITKVRDGDLLISDQYLSCEIIMSFLKAAGFDKQCALIVSNYGKHHGEIWPAVLARFDIERHLGDNPHADGYSPAQHGIDFELTDRSQIQPVEKILFEAQFSKLASLMRALRLTTWEEDNIRRRVQETQLLLNFPILIFSSMILRKTAQHLNKSRIVFSARDCFKWKILFETLFPNEFECEYYYTSRYSKCLGDEDYISYSNKIISDDCIIVDLCGSGWSLEKFAQDLLCETLDVFFIHKMPQNRDYMQDSLHPKCRFHHIVENSFDVYKNHILEIANFASHPMLRTMANVKDVFCPIFFKEGRSDTELSYIALQHETFDACVDAVSQFGIDEHLTEFNVNILCDLVKIFYRLLSQDVFSHTVYAANFFKENGEVESKLAQLSKSRRTHVDSRPF